MAETTRRGPPPPDAPKTEARRVPEGAKRAAPVTRVKSGGRINRRLEDLANLYLKEHPEMSVRWVYDPTHKPDLSNMLSRQIDGYVVVYVKDLGDSLALPGMKPDEPVRIGDTVMMAIAESEAREMRADLDAAAADELTRVEQEFQHSVEEIVTTKGGKTYSPRPLGRSVIEEVEREVEGPETHKE